MNSVSRFLPPVAIFLVGMIILGVGLIGGQSLGFLGGGAAIVLVGVFTLLTAADLFNGPIRIVVTVILALLSATLVYADYRVIKKDLDFQAEKRRRYDKVIQRLKDIRQAQAEYKRAFGVYTPSFDTLLHFVKYDSVFQIKVNGNVPDSLTEAEALEQGILRRDTSIIAAIEVVYNQRYLETRAKYRLDVDSLPFVPFTDGARFEMNAGEVEKGSTLVPVFEVVDSKPFDPADVEDPLRVGSMSDPTTAGNWE